MFTGQYQVQQIATLLSKITKPSPFLYIFYYMQTSKGLLGTLLGKERADRARRADEMPRHSRFGGQFRVATTSSKCHITPDQRNQMKSTVFSIQHQCECIHACVFVYSLSLTFNIK